MMGINANHVLGLATRQGLFEVGVGVAFLLTPHLAF